jgi:hypothetical protein
MLEYRRRLAVSGFWKSEDMISNVVGCPVAVDKIEKMERTVMHLLERRVPL